MIAGRFGSGKSFLIQMIRNNAMEKNLVVCDCDLSPERRLTGTKGQGLATYRELMHNLSILSRPEGGALEAIIQKWISQVQINTAKEYNLKANSIELIDKVSEKISESLLSLSSMVFGFAFAKVVDSYWRGMKLQDEDLKQSSLRWLHGEISTKTEAKKLLNVDVIIDDSSWYDFIKLFAMFIKNVGYKGLMVFIDEGVNLYKIANKQARDMNYEKILTIFNDTMQGRAQYLGVFLSGTHEFVYDERRGLFNYEALRSRLISNSFESEDIVDYTSPVIKLNRLRDEELYLLLERLVVLHSKHYGYEINIKEDDITNFLNFILKRIGADSLLTPRELTRDFLGILNILEQNENLEFNDLLKDEMFKNKKSDNLEKNTKEKENNESEVNKEIDDLFLEFDI